MVSTTFYCDFCGQRITNRSINPDHMGFCRSIPEDTPTNDFTKNLEGTHICYSCVRAFFEGDVTLSIE